MNNCNSKWQNVQYGRVWNDHIVQNCRGGQGATGVLQSWRIIQTVISGAAGLFQFDWILIPIKNCNIWQSALPASRSSCLLLWLRSLDSRSEIFQYQELLLVQKCFVNGCDESPSAEFPITQLVISSLWPLQKHSSLSRADQLLTLVMWSWCFPRLSLFYVMFLI